MFDYVKKTVGFVLLGLLGIAIGYWVLITPENPILRIFRGEISDVSANIITGPYPIEKDFKRLSENNIKMIVSLLDPALPYEKQLLDQESELAGRYGMQLLNFPMASILGQKFGAYYEQNATRAAETIANHAGKLYLHCYLGVHRIGTVKKLLEAKQIKVARYTLQEGERSGQALKLDAAEVKFNEGDYQQALKLLDEIRAPTPASVLLHAWVNYKLGNIDAARKYFETAEGLLPSSTDPLIGSAYCDYRDSVLPAAEQGFTKVLAKEPDNVEALNGLGLVLTREKRLKEAADYFRKVLQLQPKHQEAQDQLQKIEANPIMP